MARFDNGVLRRQHIVHRVFGSFFENILIRFLDMIFTAFCFDEDYVRIAAVEFPSQVNPREIAAITDFAQPVQ